MFVNLPSQPNRFDPHVEDARVRHRNKFVRAEATPSLMPAGSTTPAPSHFRVPTTDFNLVDGNAAAGRTQSHGGSSKHKRQVSFGGATSDEHNTSVAVSHTPTGSFAFDGGLSFHISGNPRDFQYGEDAPASALRGVKKPTDHNISNPSSATGPHRRTMSDTTELGDSFVNNASAISGAAAAGRGPSHEYLLRREHQASPRRLTREAHAPSTSRVAADKNQQRYLASANHRQVFDPEDFQRMEGVSIKESKNATIRSVDQRKKTAANGELLPWNRNKDVMEAMKDSNYRPIRALPRRQEDPTIQALKDLTDDIADRSTIGASELFHTHAYRAVQHGTEAAANPSYSAATMIPNYSRAAISHAPSTNHLNNYLQQRPDVQHTAVRASQYQPLQHNSHQSCHSPSRYQFGDEGGSAAGMRSVIPLKTQINKTAASPRSASGSPPSVLRGFSRDNADAVGRPSYPTPLSYQHPAAPSASPAHRHHQQPSVTVPTTSSGGAAQPPMYPTQRPSDVPTFFAQVPPPYTGPLTPAGLIYSDASQNRGGGNHSTTQRQQNNSRGKYSGFDGDMDGDDIPDDGRVDPTALPSWVGIQEANIIAGLLESQGVDAIKHSEVTKYHMHSNFLSDIKKLVNEGGYLVRYAPLRIGDSVGPDPKERFFRISLIGAANGLRTTGFSRDDFVRNKHTGGKNRKGTKGLTEGGGKDRTFQRAVLQCRENSHISATVVSQYQLSNLVGVTRDVSTPGYSPHRVYTDGSVGNENVEQLIVPLAPHPTLASDTRRSEYRHHQARLLKSLKENVTGLQGHRFASSDRKYRLLHADNAFSLWFLDYETDEVDLVEVCAQSAGEADLWCRVLKGFLAVNSTRLEPKPKKIKGADPHVVAMLHARRQREQIHANQQQQRRQRRDSGATDTSTTSRISGNDMLVLKNKGGRKKGLPPQAHYEDEFYDIEGDSTTDEDTDNSDHEQEMANSKKPALETLHAFCRFIIDSRNADHLKRQDEMSRL